MTTTLVTGATAGIGHAFAVELAERGHNLVLVARDEPRLQAQAKTLADTYGITVDVLRADLANRSEVQTVADRLADDQRPVDMLINNAGFGLARSFLNSDLADQEDLLGVLCTAVLVLSHAAGNAMRRRGTGTIITVSSVASYTTMGTYAAAKAWATTFTESLHEELKKDGVHAMALCPGFVRTEFHQRANMKMTSLPDSWWLTAQNLVRSCLADAEKGVAVSVPSLRYKALAFAAHYGPRPLIRRASARVRDVRDTSMTSTVGQ